MVETKLGIYVKKRVTTRVRLIGGVSYKDCSVCGEVKLLSEFYIEKRKNKPEAACRSCYKAYERKRHRTWYKMKHREICETYRENLKSEVYAAYGYKCACCGEYRHDFLQIDHVNGQGKAHRKEVGAGNLHYWLKKNGFPKDGFRLLCANCNFSIGIHGSCPHERERANQICAD